MKLRHAIIGASLAVGSLTTLAWAHSTGHQARTAAECNRLPVPERQQCLPCIARAVRHHYHPDYPPQSRCRPDNGRP